MFTLRFSQLSVEEIAAQAQQALHQSLAEWEKHVWQFVLWWADEAVQEIEVHTSGSTGTPKAIKHTKQAMLASAKATCDTLQIPEACEALLCLPANKIGGMMMIVRSIYKGMDLLCTQPDTKPFDALADNHTINFAALTPMQMKYTDSSYEAFKKMERIHSILLGGEAVSVGLIKHLSKAKNSIYATFGMTETISHIALKKLNGPNADGNFKALQGVSVTTDERNCLVINAPALNVRQLHTNDIIDLVNEHEFSWVGRYDNVINTGGVKIYPEIIEQKLLPNIALPFFIAGKPDEATGQKPVILIETDKLSDADYTELNTCFAQLDKYERPREIITIRHFMRTSNGKIDRNRTLALV